jgi:hypothetical protein
MRLPDNKTYRVERKIFLNLYCYGQEDRYVREKHELKRTLILYGRFGKTKM